MKKIEAIIRPRELDTVRGSYVVESCSQLKLELAVPDAAVDQIVSLVCGVTRTKDSGDGKVFVSWLDDIVRVRPRRARRAGPLSPRLQAPHGI